MDPNKSISEIMTRNLVCVRPTETANNIRAIFKEHDFHHLPVTEEDGKLAGIISKSDFLRITFKLSSETSGSVWSEKTFNHLTAKDLMTPYPLWIQEDDTIGLAADIFLANKFHALPVMEDDELVGLVTTHDLLAYTFKSPIET